MMKTKYILICLIIMIISSGVIAQIDPGTENLIHSWTFDNGSAVDTVGGAEGVLMGAAKILNGALQTTSIDSWMELPSDTIAINQYDELTTELWFRSVPNANTGFNMIAAFGNTQNSIGVDYYFLTPTRGDDVSRTAISCGDASTPWASETGSNGTEYDDGIAHQMVSIIDSVNITLYIDGQLQSTTPLDSNNRISEISTNYAYLAKSLYEADPSWRGEIFEFNIYDKALSADGVLFLYEKANFGAGDKPVTVEAESGELGSLFTTMEDGDISYITTTESYTGIASPGDTNRIASYELTFLDSGYYSLYVRLRVGSGSFDDDSFFYSRGFGEKDDTASSDWVFVNGLGAAGFTDSANIVYDAGAAGSEIWKWVNVSKNTYSGALGDSFYVSLDSLTQIFQIASREDGLDIDKIVFGKSNLYFSVGNLNNGEAGSAVLPGSENAWNGPPLATNQPKFVGNIYSGSQVNNFESYWNAVIPENEGKWGSVEGTRDNMNWGGLDAAYAMAKDNDFPFNFHVLLWGAQQPSWINDLTVEEQLAEIREWFEAVAERYPDIDYLQVVNEPLVGHNPPDGNNGRANYKIALGGDGDTGYDWVITAFRMARDVFPDTKLMINDFNIINNTNSTNTYLNIINQLKAENLIDVIGVQGHAFTTTSPTATLRSNLNKLATAGLPIQVTELDIDGLTDDIQLNEYKRIFPALYEHPKVEGIVLWGWRPGLWRNDEAAYIVNQDGTERPAMIWLRNYLDTLNVNPVSVDDLAKIPNEYRLENNYPNPFNPSTVISYQIPSTSQVTLKVYSVLGEEVAILFKGVRQPGYYEERFNGSNLTSGVYIYRLTANDFVDTKKLMLVK